MGKFLRIFYLHVGSDTKSISQKWEKHKATEMPLRNLSQHLRRWWGSGGLGHPVAGIAILQKFVKSFIKIRENFLKNRKRPS